MSDRPAQDSNQLPHPRRALRTGKKHILVSLGIAAACVASVAVVWADAPVRHSSLTRDPHVSFPLEKVASLQDAPPAVHEVWRRKSVNNPAWKLPVTDAASGLVFAGSSHAVVAVSASTGKPAWTYRRDKKLCLFNTASWGNLVADYRSGMGCGDVTAIRAAKATYAATRSAYAPDKVAPIRSNSAVGYVAPHHMELWRSDLVRTIEYGKTYGKQEPGMQPNEDCTINSALTRTNLLAIVETCARNHVESSAAHGKNSPATPDHQYWLRLIKSVPKDSRKPEFHASVALPGPGKLVAIGQTAAAVYVEAPTPRVLSYSTEGKLLATTAVSKMPSHPIGDGAVYTPMVADLPHHMSLFTGKGLWLFTPDKLAVDLVFPDAVGTPVAIADRLIYPTATGLSVTTKDKKAVAYTIPVNRDGYTGPVGLALVGNVVVEKRGDSLVGLAMTS